MTTTSQIPAVVDYLVAQCQASTSIGAATPPVIVLDGPQVTDDTLAEPLHLWIGHDAYAGGDPAATAVQDFAEIGSNAALRDEDGEITCTAEAWAGGDVIKAQRDACAAIVAAVELLLRGRPLDGGPGDTEMGGLVLWSQVSGPYTWYQQQSQEGSTAGCVFKITYKARLLTG